uniref:DUF3453 domain-containing protein n=1 Tax=Heterorhabditis bacteriophora TaxID=37862 RepID=A0A1I7XNN6_HETBA
MNMAGEEVDSSDPRDAVWLSLVDVIHVANCSKLEFSVAVSALNSNFLTMITVMGGNETTVHKLADLCLSGISYLRELSVNKDLAYDSQRTSVGSKDPSEFYFKSNGIDNDILSLINLQWMALRIRLIAVKWLNIRCS